MAKNDPEFRLRLPADLKAAIEQLAKDNDRSINSEIVARLKESLSWAEYDIAGIAADLEKLEDRVRELEDMCSGRDPNDYYK